MREIIGLMAILLMIFLAGAGLMGIIRRGAQLCVPAITTDGPDTLETSVLSIGFGAGLLPLLLFCYMILLIVTPADTFWQLRVAFDRLLLHFAPIIIYFMSRVYEKS